MVNISFIALKGKIVDSYDKTLKNWNNKDVLWDDVKKVVSNSKIQYSPYGWDRQTKHPNNFNRSNQDCIVFDIDDGMSISEFMTRYSNYDFIIATTKSHQADKKGLVCDRFRVIMKAINISMDNEVFFRSMELLCPENDKQTLTKTASFLGNDGAIVIYNNGKAMDMYKANEVAEEQLKNEYVETVVIDRDLVNSYGGNMNDVRDSIDYQVTADVVSALGYEVIGNKFMLREERTPSCKIYQSGYMVDYGGEFKGDILQLLIDYKGMNFRDAVSYVRNFI